MHNPEEFPAGPKRPPLPPLSAMGWLVEARCHPPHRAASEVAEGAAENGATTVGVRHMLGRLPGFLRLRSARLRHWWHLSKDLTTATVTKAR